MVVAHGDEIYFFKNDTKIRKFTVANISDITALAYDCVNCTLYISDGYVILYSSDLVDENLDSEFTFHRISYTGQHATIWLEVFDPVTKALFWDEAGTLMKMEVASHGIDSSLHQRYQNSELHYFADSNDLNLDICHRFIYRTINGDRGGDGIERSRLDGTDREVILSNDPSVFFNGFAVDHYGGKLYFVTSDIAGLSNGNIKIEESNLDGTGRRVLVNAIDAIAPERKYLAVDETAVYWNGRAVGATIWKVFKNRTAMRDIEPSYSQADSFHSHSNILTRRTVEGLDCKAVLDKEQIKTPEQLPAESQVTARLAQLSNKMDRLLTNQNQLLLALIGLLDDARLTHTATISRIDALKPNILDKVQHPEN